LQCSEGGFVNESKPTIYSPQDVADLLGISRATVLRKCREGTWPHRRLTAQTIIFTADDLDALLEASRAGRLGAARQP
jgi:excisionase family DNA binding protein